MSQTRDVFLPPPAGKLMPPPEPGDPVFQDRSGLRHRSWRRVFRFGLLALLLWLVALIVLALQPGSERSPEQMRAEGETAAHLAGAARGGPNPELPTVRALADAPADPDPKTGQRGRCRPAQPMFGAAMASAAEARHSGRRIYAILPMYLDNAFLPLERHCGLIDAILPEWFEIDADALRVEAASLDTELTETVASVRAARGKELTFLPVYSAGGALEPRAFLDRITKADARSGLVQAMLTSAAGVGADGLCLRLRGVSGAELKAALPFLHELSDAARAAGMTRCLITDAGSRQWAEKTVTTLFDTVVVTLFHEPWMGSVPAPLAPQDWFRSEAREMRSLVGQKKLVIALGGHAEDWVSGRAGPERLSLAGAMHRIAGAGAEIRFSPTALNSYAEFADASGVRHQIWMLDAASAYNAVKTLDDLGIAGIGLASPGDEEPAFWDALARWPAAVVGDDYLRPTFPDRVLYNGTGSFYSFGQAPRTGLRKADLEESSGMIVGQDYLVVPEPVTMERFGTSSGPQIALTFDDGPDPVATTKILDVLRRHNAPATFFVVGRSAMVAPGLLTRAIAEGHIIGSHTFGHPHMDAIGSLRARTEIRSNRMVIEGLTGSTPLLYRPPYVRGPGPLDLSEALVFGMIGEEGHIVVGSDIVPPDWAGLGAEEIVAEVLSDLETTGGNVIVLHDGRSQGMHTAAAVDLLIPALRERGYQIVPVPVLLGLDTAAMMPEAPWATTPVKTASIRLIGGLMQFAILALWLCLFVSFLRNLLYFLLAWRRVASYPSDFAPPPPVTVIVPAYNEEAVIVATLRSVLASDYPRLHCIVVDDGSSDRTAAVLQAAFDHRPDVTLITQPNQGKWSALNRGFALSETPVTICLDADTQIDPRAIRALVKPFSDPRVGAVAGTVTVGNRRGFLTRFQNIEYIVSQQISRRAQEHLDAIMVVPGALGAWRTDIVRNAGGFSGETLAEDTDLTILLRRGGYRVAYAEEARAATEAPADIASLMKQRLRWTLGNLQAIWRHRRAVADLGPRRSFSMLDMLLFGFVVPALAPIADLTLMAFAVSVFADWSAGNQLRIPAGMGLALLLFLMVQLMDFLAALIALRCDRRSPLRLALLVPLMNLLYRPLLCITVYRALWAALTGRLSQWNKLRRRGLEGQAGVQAP